MTDADIKESLGATDLIFPKQVHGNTVARIQTPTEPLPLPTADAILTNQPHLGIGIVWADCQNFLLYAPSKKILGLIHAGWRGLLRGVIPNTFKTLEQTWEINPKEILVWAGPSLCQKCSDFSDPKRELPGIDTEFFDGRCVDLRGIAESQLFEAGVLPANFERHPDCTRCHTEKYWTYRGGDREAGNVCRNVLACTLR